MFLIFTEQKLELDGRCIRLTGPLAMYKVRQECPYHTTVKGSVILECGRWDGNEAWEGSEIFIIQDH